MLELENSNKALSDTGDILLSAKAKYKQGDYLGAIAEYTLAIDFAPNVALAVCCRGDAYYKLGKQEQALADYDRAIELEPTMTLAYYRRGNLHYSVKKYDLAIAEYSLAIDRKSDFAMAYLNRGYAQRELYGELEGVSDWQSAANLFREQGSLDRYQQTIDLIDLNSSIDTLSGMLS